MTERSPFVPLPLDIFAININFGISEIMIIGIKI